MLCYDNTMAVWPDIIAGHYTNHLDHLHNVNLHYPCVWLRLHLQVLLSWP